MEVRRCAESSHGRGKMTEGLNVWRNESHTQGFRGLGWVSIMLVPGMFGLADARLLELKGTLGRKALLHFLCDP